MYTVLVGSLVINLNKTDLLPALTNHVVLSAKMLVMLLISFKSLNYLNFACMTSLSRDENRFELRIDITTEVGNIASMSLQNHILPSSLSTAAIRKQQIAVFTMFLLLSNKKISAMYHVTGLHG